MHEIVPTFVSHMSLYVFPRQSCSPVSPPHNWTARARPTPRSSRARLFSVYCDNTSCASTTRLGLGILGDDFWEDTRMRATYICVNWSILWGHWKQYHLSLQFWGLWKTIKPMVLHRCLTGIGDNQRIVSLLSAMALDTRVYHLCHRILPGPSRLLVCLAMQKCIRESQPPKPVFPWLLVAEGSNRNAWF